MAKITTIYAQDIWKQQGMTSAKLWRELQKLTADDKDTTYVIDFHAVDVSTRLTQKACKTLVCQPNVRFKVYSKALETLLNVAILSNVPNYSLQSQRVTYIPEAREILEAVEVNVALKEKIEGIKRTFMTISGNVCLICYPNPIEVDEEMMGCIRDTIASVAFDDRYSEVTKFELSINTTSMTKGARVYLWEILSNSNKVAFNNKEVVLDLDIIRDNTLKCDLEAMLHIKHLRITKEERELFFKYSLPMGTAGLFVKYKKRTNGQGNLNNVVYRNDNEIIFSRIGIYTGLDPEGMAIFKTLNANTCTTEEDFRDKYGEDATRPDAEIIEERVSVSDLGYADEFIGNTEFLRFDPNETTETILNGKRVSVSDALYAKALLDSYKLEYNEQELNYDIGKAKKMGDEFDK